MFDPKEELQILKTAHKNALHLVKMEGDRADMYEEALVEEKADHEVTKAERDAAIEELKAEKNARIEDIRKAEDERAELLAEIERLKQERDWYKEHQLIKAENVFGPNSMPTFNTRNIYAKALPEEPDAS